MTYLTSNNIRIRLIRMFPPSSRMGFAEYYGSVEHCLRTVDLSVPPKIYEQHVFAVPEQTIGARMIFLYRNGTVRFSTRRSTRFPRTRSNTTE